MNFTKPITELPPKPAWVKQAESSPVGTIRVLKKELEERYFHYAVLPESLFFATADKSGYLDVPAKTIASVEEKLESEIAKQKAMYDCVDRNNRGAALEKDGHYDEAIALYEENIKDGCWPTMHPFDRLLVIYRSRKDYNNELRVCKRALSVFNNLNKYKTRMEKVIRLIEHK